MKMIPRFRDLTRTAAAFYILMALASLVHAQSSQERADRRVSGNNRNYERITAHLMGVYGPRGYFNLVVGLYS